MTTPTRLMSFLQADTSVALSEHTVGTLLVERANQVAEQLVLVATDHAGVVQRLTYGQLMDQALCVAGGLQRLAAPGDHVALWAPNVMEWPVIEFGAALAGVVLVALNPVLRPHELGYALKHSQARVLVHADRSRDYDLASVVTDVSPTCPALEHVVSLSCMDALRADPSELPIVSPDAPAMLQYTSGTTGLPKGVLLRHRALVNNAKLTMEAAAVPPAAVCFNPLPTFHTASCVIGTLGPVWVGGVILLQSRFMPDQAVETMRREQASVLFAVPTVLGAVLEVLGADEAAPLPLKHVLVGAANVPGSMIEKVQRLLGASVHNLFGQTELAPVLSLTRHGDTDEDLVGSVGRPLPHVDVKIVDPVRGDVLPVGEVGEICARGYQQLIEYYGDQPATEAAIDADGWLHLGDLGRLDSRGVLWLSGRLKDLIIRGGENIAPAEVENVLVSHSAVLEAAVVGLPDERWGEVVVAAVRLREPATAAGLIEFCRSRLAPSKVPTRIAVLDELPTTASGKVQKFRLREQLAPENPKESN